MNFENFNCNFENVDVEQALEAVQGFLEGGFHSPEAREFRAQLRAACPELTAEQAALVLPWVDALAAHLRQVAAPKAPAPKAPAPKAQAPKAPKAPKELENFFFLGM